MTHDLWPGVSGDHDCVLSSCSIPGVTDRCTRGPVARYVWDLARREDSLWVVPLGASGVPGNAHHRDQLPLWLRGELIPVVTDWNELTQESHEPMNVIPRAPVYEQRVEGFGTVRIVPVAPCGDIDLIYAWVTQERARFWGMRNYSREYVLEIYEYLDSLTTHHAYLVHRDDRPVALFQTYDPAYDPVGACYDVQPGDLGLHLLIGPAYEGGEPGFTGALMSALLRFALMDPAVKRLVGEPDVRNAKAIARLLRCGFVLGPEIDLPEKRARLLFLTPGAR